MKIIYIKRMILPLICLIFIIFLVIFSGTAFNAALRGVDLWLNIVFPSLFPFLTVSAILNSTGFIKASGVLFEPLMRPLFNVPGCGSFAFIMGITSGYPVGAKITSNLRAQKLLTKVEAERLLTFTNNSGPLFIIGAVSVGMFKMPALGLFLLSCHILASITVGLLFKFYRRNDKTTRNNFNVNLREKFIKELIQSLKSSRAHLGAILGDAVKDSFSTLFVIGGFIVLFSVIINLLFQTGLIQYISYMLSILFNPIGIKAEIFSSVLSGFFEITTGTNMTSEIKSAPFSHQLSAASFIIGWAGLSVHSQVSSIISKTDINIKPYMLGKLLQGVFAAAYTLVGIKITGFFLQRTEPAFFSSNILKTHCWHEYFLYSCGIIAAVLSLFMLCVIFIGVIRWLKLLLKKINGLF